jgi:hypothetical protein
MPARIVETNQTPLQRVAIDPIPLDIAENALKKDWSAGDGGRSRNRRGT